MAQILRAAVVYKKRGEVSIEKIFGFGYVGV